MPGRDIAYFWRFGTSYLLGAYWVAAGLWWVPGIPGLVPCALGAVIAAYTAWSEYRYRRSTAARLRRELLALLRERARTEKEESFWLNRDAHLVFHAWYVGPRLIRAWNIARADEDQARGLDEAGRYALTGDLFQAIAVKTQVLHQVIGAIAVVDGDGNADLEQPERLKFFRYAWRTWRMERTGMLYAGPDELRELLSQFREAEPVDPEMV